MKFKISCMYGGELIIKGFSECIEMSSKNKITAEGLPVSQEVIRKILKKDDWRFDWKMEYRKPDRHLFYLRTCTDDRRVQGLISATPMTDGRHIFLNLIETAPHNYGRNKQYDNVPQSLVAYMCKASFEFGFDGFVAFDAKTVLIDHYIRKFGAESVTPRNKRMFISSISAKKLVNLYLKML